MSNKNGTSSWPYKTSGHFCLVNGYFSGIDKYFIGDPFYFDGYVPGAPKTQEVIRVNTTELGPSLILSLLKNSATQNKPYYFN